jgi:hypothetical protein
MHYQWYITHTATPVRMIDSFDNSIGEGATKRMLIWIVYSCSIVYLRNRHNSEQASKREKGLWVHGWKLSASPRTYGAAPIYIDRAECGTAARSICDMISTQRRQTKRLLGKPIKQATHSVRVYKAWGQFANIKKDHYSSH